MTKEIPMQYNRPRNTESFLCRHRAFVQVVFNISLLPAIYDLLVHPVLNAVQDKPAFPGYDIFNIPIAIAFIVAGIWANSTFAECGSDRSTNARHSTNVFFPLIVVLTICIGIPYLLFSAAVLFIPEPTRTNTNDQTNTSSVNTNALNEENNEASVILWQELRTRYDRVFPTKTEAEREALNIGCSGSHLFHAETSQGPVEVHQPCTTYDEYVRALASLDDFLFLKEVNAQAASVFLTPEEALTAAATDGFQCTQYHVVPLENTSRGSVSVYRPCDSWEQYWEEYKRIFGT